MGLLSFELSRFAGTWSLAGEACRVGCIGRIAEEGASSRHREPYALVVRHLRWLLLVPVELAVKRPLSALNVFSKNPPFEAHLNEVKVPDRIPQPKAQLAFRVCVPQRPKEVVPQEWFFWLQDMDRKHALRVCRFPINQD